MNQKLRTKVTSSNDAFASWINERQDIGSQAPNLPPDLLYAKTIFTTFEVKSVNRLLQWFHFQISFGDYFGNHVENPYEPVKFPISLEGQDAFTYWKESCLIRECVQYRKRTIWCNEEYQYQVYICSHQPTQTKAQSTETVQKIGCPHKIEVRFNSMTKEVLISSSQPQHSHIPGEISDIKRLKVCDSIRAEIIQLHLLGYANKDIKSRLQNNLISEIEQNERNYNIRYTYLQNHRAVIPTIKDVYNVIASYKRKQNQKQTDV